nr:hypothetical protein GTC16762_15800 [Pigmentibacter ruber]
MRKILILLSCFILQPVFAKCMEFNEEKFEHYLKSKSKIELIFFSSWCSDCKEDLLKIRKNQKNLKDKVVIINTFDRLEKANTALKALEIELDCYFDRDRVLTKKYNIKAVPAHVYVNQ